MQSTSHICETLILRTYCSNLVAYHMSYDPMKNVLILGGSGKVARYLTQLLIQENYIVHGIIRNSDQSKSLRELGSHPIVQSIEACSVSELAATISDIDPDIVIWSAGAGTNGYGDPARHRSISRDGAVKAIDALHAAGYKKRYIIVSSMDLRNREKVPYPEWYDDQDKAISDKVWQDIPAYMESKLQADKALVAHNVTRDLKYTIVRPNLYNQDPATGKVSAGKIHMVNTVSREDVARVILACIEDDRTIGLAFDVAGGEIPIAKAIDQVVEKGMDTFVGMF